METKAYKLLIDHIWHEKVKYLCGDEIELPPKYAEKHPDKFEPIEPEADQGGGSDAVSPQTSDSDQEGDGNDDRREHPGSEAPLTGPETDPLVNPDGSMREVKLAPAGPGFSRIVDAQTGDVLLPTGQEDRMTTDQAKARLAEAEATVKARAEAAAG